MTTTTANGRRPAPMGGATRTGEVEKIIPFGLTPEQWETLLCVITWLRADAFEEGCTLGERRAWDRAWEWTVRLFGPTYEPRAAFVPSADPPPPCRVSDRRPLTAAQIVAGARWSWAQVERRIAEAGGRATA